MAMAAMNLPRPQAQGLRRAVPDTLAALVAEVSGIVSDPSVSEDDVVRALGRGLYAAAAATRLPDLSAWAELAFAPGQADAPLPADLMHGPVDAFLLPARGGRTRDCRPGARVWPLSAAAGCMCGPCPGKRWSSVLTT